MLECWIFKEASCEWLLYHIFIGDVNDFFNNFIFQVFIYAVLSCHLERRGDHGYWIMISEKQIE